HLSRGGFGGAITALAGIVSLHASVFLTACHQQQKIPTLMSESTLGKRTFAIELPGLDVGRRNVALSRMNAQPAGSGGFVRSLAGHFADEQGRRLRFFGVNLAGPACAPGVEIAGQLARALSDLGVNAVRFTGLDALGVLLQSDGSLDPAAFAR